MVILFTIKPHKYTLSFALLVSNTIIIVVILALTFHTTGFPFVPFSTFPGAPAAHRITGRATVATTLTVTIIAKSPGATFWKQHIICFRQHLSRDVIFYATLFSDFYLK